MKKVFAFSDLIKLGARGIAGLDAESCKAADKNAAKVLCFAAALEYANGLGGWRVVAYDEGGEPYELDVISQNSWRADADGNAVPEIASTVIATEAPEIRDLADLSDWDDVATPEEIDALDAAINAGVDNDALDCWREVYCALEIRDFIREIGG